MQSIVDAILGYLQAEHADDPAVGRLTSRLDAIDVRVPDDPAPPLHAAALAATVDAIEANPSTALASVGRSIRAAGPSLSWRVDDGRYYSGDAEISTSYRDGNMHAPLVEGDDFVMGLFLLLPDVDYLDHRHRAPEFYLNLTGPTRWRFDHGEWRDQPAGSVLWNDSGAVHATRTGSEPWLSVFVWLEDIDHLCEVVPEVV